MKRGTNPGSWKRIAGLEFCRRSEKIVFSKNEVCKEETKK